MKRANITPEDIRRCLAGTRLPSSPLDIVMPPDSATWPQELRAQLVGELKPAGVLVPVLENDDGLSLLLTQRSAELKHHAGQVSFPGGRMEAHDESVEATALRETHEEVGISPDQVAVAGYLSPMPTVTGYAVTPVVGLIDRAATLLIDHSEVEYTFEVPLGFLLKAGSDVLVEREMFGAKIPMVEFHWGGERIWGATAMMIVSLRKALLKE